MSERPVKHQALPQSTKGESIMNRLVKVVLVISLVSGFAVCAQRVQSDWTSPQPAAQEPPQAAPSQTIKVMREYKGVKLGASREQVHTALGKPATASENLEDFSLPGDDSMTVHYENDAVKAIQISFLDSKTAPAMKDVVGETAEVSQLDNGATHARTNVSEEKFWVSYYQSKDGLTTRVTISRQ
jgi:hypothetical protein